MRWKHIWISAWQRKDFWLRFVGLLVFAMGLSTFAATTESIEIATHATVSEHWRGAYDLLVRPPQSVLPTEKAYGVVEGNYLGTPQGGITLDQYRLIAGMSDVDVAAPVATIGYFLNTTGTVSFRMPFEENRLYHATVNMEGQHAEFNRSWESFWMQMPPEKNAPAQPTLPRFWGAESNSVGVGPGEIFFGIGNLPMQWTLLAGVDQMQEAHLAGLPDGLVKGRYFEPDDSTLKTVYDPAIGPEPVPEIPILVSQSGFWGDTRLSVSVESVLAWPDSLAQADLEAVKRFWQENSPEVLVAATLPFEGNLAPLSGETVLVASNGLSVGDEGFLSIVDHNVVLYPAAASYQALERWPEADAYSHAFAVQSLGTWDDLIAPALQAARSADYSETFLAEQVSVLPDAPVFRPLTPRSLPPFAFKVLGWYDFQALAAPQDPLAYVPLGIYEPPAGVVRYDENGTPLPEGQPYYPDLNPAGFLPRPPLALTTLEAAQYLSGRDDFIDAIRVRLKGIDTYTPENLARVEAVAAEIVERTGLHVDIVAGSSPQRVLVSVPGVGYVEEPWTTLGAAVQVSSGINTANLMLLLTLLLASVLFTAEISQISLLGRYQELGTLRAVGWDAASLLRYLLADALLLGAVSGSVAVLASLVLNAAAGLHITPVVLAAVFALGVLAYLTGAAWPAWRVTREQPVSLLQRGEMHFPSRLAAPRRLPGMAGLAWRQLWLRRSRFLLSAFVVALSVALNIFLLGVLWTLRGRLQITLLGSFVSLHLRSYHMLMAVIALTMSFLAVLSNLLLSVTERAHEFALMRAVGWSQRVLRGLVLTESLWSVLAGAIPGALGGLLALFILLQHFDWQWLWMLPVAGLAAVGMALLAAWQPVRRVARLMPAPVLSAEGRRPDEETSARSAYRGGLILAAVFLALLLTALLGGRADVARHAAGLDHTPTPTVPAVLQDAPLDEAMGYLAVLTDLGPRSIFQSEAQSAAADLIASTLQAQGWQVTRQAVPLPVLDLQRSGQPDARLQLPADTALVTALAVHFNALQPGNALSAPLLYWSPGEPLPTAEQMAGRIVLVLNSGIDRLPGQVLSGFVHQTDAASAAAVVEVLVRDGMQSLTLSDGNLADEGQLYVSQNVLATFPGQSDRAPVWLAASFVSGPESAGANQSASASAALLAWAEKFAQKAPARPVQLIFLGGDGDPFDGMLRFLQDEPQRQPAAVLFFDTLGDWDTLSYASRLDAPEVVNGSADIQAQAALQKLKGQADQRGFWLSLLDLDRPDLADWLDFWEQKSRIGLEQTPDFLVAIAQSAAEDDPAMIEPAWQNNCTPLLFLFRDHPALGICAAGFNANAGTPFDTLDRIDRMQYRRALALGYRMIEILLESNLP
ncbi:MAG: hypothetical protein Fur0018_01660 [Anaerolineales bacterium]